MSDYDGLKEGLDGGANWEEEPHLPVPEGLPAPEEGGEETSEEDLATQEEPRDLKVWGLRTKEVTYQGRTYHRVICFEWPQIICTGFSRWSGYHLELHATHRGVLLPPLPYARSGSLRWHYEVVPTGRTYALITHSSELGTSWDWNIPLPLEGEVQPPSLDEEPLKRLVEEISYWDPRKNPPPQAVIAEELVMAKLFERLEDVQALHPKVLRPGFESPLPRVNLVTAHGAGTRLGEEGKEGIYVSLKIPLSAKIGFFPEPQRVGGKNDPREFIWGTQVFYSRPVWKFGQVKDDETGEAYSYLYYTDPRERGNETLITLGSSESGIQARIARGVFRVGRFVPFEKNRRSDE